MIVIADSNIFYSALISPEGTTASILRERKRIQFVVPDYLIDEVNGHLLRIKSYLNEEKTIKQLSKDFKELLRGIPVIPLDSLEKENLLKAQQIVKEVDKDDYPFIALHLEIKHKIWSGDKELRKGLTAKGYGHFFVTTEELRQKLYKKQWQLLQNYINLSEISLG